MGDLVKQILARPIQLSDSVIAAADLAESFKQECSEIKSKTEKLVTLLRQAARASNDLYERPTRRIIDEAVQVLEKALALVIKCRGHGLMKRVFTIIPTAAFRKMLSQLENSIGDVSWLLRVSAPAVDRDDEYLGLPPIAANEPILGLIWEQIAALCTASIADRGEAAASLVSLARDNERYGKLIIEEGGILPLLKLLKDGTLEGQDNAATAIGLLGRDPESIEHMIDGGVCSVFAKILKEAPMKVQATVAWAVSILTANDRKCQEIFAQHNIIRLLVGHLAFETVQEHSKYAVASKATSVHAAVVLASSNTVNDGLVKGSYLDEEKKHISHPFGHKNPTHMYSVVTTAMNGGNSVKGREMEDPAMKAGMKAMAAKALCQLAKGNPTICRSITESRALLCFAVLMEKGPEEVKFDCAMALMEITAVAEEDADLRRSAFKPNSPACKAVVDQLYRVVAEGKSNLLLPSVKAIGNLARTFKATETRMIGPLVKLLDEREAAVTREACIALSKFSCKENYLHVDHSKAIIEAGGAKHLVQIAYFGDEMVKRPGVVLLCYVAMHVPDSEGLAEAGALSVLEWASKQNFFIQVEELLMEAKVKLELYQSRGGYHHHHH